MVPPVPFRRGSNPDIPIIITPMGRASSQAGAFLPGGKQDSRREGCFPAPQSSQISAWNEGGLGASDPKGCSRQAAGRQQRGPDGEAGRSHSAIHTGRRSARRLCCARFPSRPSSVGLGGEGLGASYVPVTGGSSQFPSIEDWLNAALKAFTISHQDLSH